jgi:uncharacterized protein
VRVLQLTLIALVRLYRWLISPAKTFFFGSFAGCRFTPSCSEYALEALHSHGPIKGSWLTFKRLIRCQPWGGCGHDPVPKPCSPSNILLTDQKLAFQTNTKGKLFSKLL